MSPFWIMLEMRVTEVVVTTGVTTNKPTSQVCTGLMPLLLPGLYRLDALAVVRFVQAGCPCCCQVCTGWMPLLLPGLYRLDAVAVVRFVQA